MKKLNSSELKNVNGGATVKKAVNKKITKSSQKTTAKKGYNTAIKKSTLPKATSKKPPYSKKK